MPNRKDGSAIFGLGKAHMLQHVLAETPDRHVLANHDPAKSVQLLVCLYHDV